MPAAAALPAIGGVVGAVGNAIGQNKAQKANDRALDYAKEQEALKRKDYDARMAEYRDQKAAYDARQLPFQNMSLGVMKHFGMGGGAPPPMGNSADVARAHQAISGPTSDYLMPPPGGGMMGNPALNAPMAEMPPQAAPFTPPSGDDAAAARATSGTSPYLMPPQGGAMMRNPALNPFAGLSLGSFRGR